MDKKTKEVLRETIKELKKAKENWTYEEKMNRYEQGRLTIRTMIMQGKIAENDYRWVAFQIMDRYLRLFKKQFMNIPIHPYIYKKEIKVSILNDDEFSKYVNEENKKRVLNCLKEQYLEFEYLDEFNVKAGEGYSKDRVLYFSFISNFPQNGLVFQFEGSGK